MDTDSLYLALAEENLEDCILPEKKAQWLQIRQNDCRDKFIANSKTNFFSRTCCAVHKKHNKREPSLFREEFALLKCCACAARRIAAMIVKATNLNLAAKDSTKER